MTTETQSTIVDIEDKVKGEIQMPTLDVKPFIGVNTTIESVETHLGKHGYFIKLLTPVITTIGEGDSKKEIRATKIYGLTEDESGNVGWKDATTGKLTKLGKVLENYRVDHYDKLPGTLVKLQATEPNDLGQQFLTFT